MVRSSAVCCEAPMVRKLAPMAVNTSHMAKGRATSHQEERPRLSVTATRHYWPSPILKAHESTYCGSPEPDPCRALPFGHASGSDHSARPRALQRLSRAYHRGLLLLAHALRGSVV